MSSSSSHGEGDIPDGFLLRFCGERNAQERNNGLQVPRRDVEAKLYGSSPGHSRAGRGPRDRRCSGGHVLLDPGTERRLRAGGGGGREGANSTKWAAEVGRESMADRGRGESLQEVRGLLHQKLGKPVSSEEPRKGFLGELKTSVRHQRDDRARAEWQGVGRMDAHNNNNMVFHSTPPPQETPTSVALSDLIPRSSPPSMSPPHCPPPPGDGTRKQELLEKLYIQRERWPCKCGAAHPMRCLPDPKDPRPSSGNLHGSLLPLTFQELEEEALLQQVHPDLHLGKSSE